jgi:hypothetical protein
MVGEVAGPEARLGIRLGMVSKVAGPEVRLGTRLEMVGEVAGPEVRLLIRLGIRLGILGVVAGPEVRLGIMLGSSGARRCYKFTACARGTGGKRLEIGLDSKGQSKHSFFLPRRQDKEKSGEKPRYRPKRCDGKAVVATEMDPAPEMGSRPVGTKTLSDSLGGPAQ